MSVTTIADILNPVVPPDSPVQYPLRGTVKIAWDAKPPQGDFSSSQGFVLQDNTGEITVYWSETDGQPFVPVQKGEQVEICARLNGKNKLGGAFKKLSGPNTKKPGEPQLKVYGNHLQRLGAAPAGAHPASAQPVTHTGQEARRQAVPDPAWMNDGPPAQGFRPTPTGKLTETEARQLWARNFHALATLFGYPDQAQELVANLPAHFATLLAAASTTMLIGIQRGDILRDPIQGGPDDELGF